MSQDSVDDVLILDTCYDSDRSTAAAAINSKISAPDTPLQSFSAIHVLQASPAPTLTPVYLLWISHLLPVIDNRETKSCGPATRSRPKGKGLWPLMFLAAANQCPKHIPVAALLALQDALMHFVNRIVEFFEHRLKFRLTT